MVNSIIRSIVEHCYTLGEEWSLEKKQRYTSNPNNERLARNFCISALKIGRNFPPLKCNFSSLRKSTIGLPEDNLTVRGYMDPRMALALQDETGSEISYDLVYPLHRERIFRFVTRGFQGLVISDQLAYYCFSSWYLSLPVFHTHPSIENERGLYRPSKADEDHLIRTHEELGKRAVEALVLFPDKPSFPARWAQRIMKIYFTKD